MGISPLGFVAVMGVVALLAVLGGLLVLWVAAVVRWLDLDQADFSVGHKGVSIHMERRSRGQPTGRAQRSATRARFQSGSQKTDATIVATKLSSTHARRSKR